jgi:ABC-type multidrug transport system fused ATPase/permease subunit
VINQLYEEISKFRKVEINKNIEFSFRNKIDFKNISFKYENSNIYLKNINFTIKKNTIFGIKGKSGSGKSTCLNLITGFLNPTKGAVLVDGKSIRKNVNNWQKIIAYIPQRVFLIDGTLKENICFGIKENSIDYVKLEKALNYSQIKDFIDPNQGGLNKLLGERGKKISAGQIQRIGLARALYKSPQILILDESTSALDKKTENKILQDVSKLKNIMTIIIVSHSEEVLSFCDSTYNLDLKNK